MKEIVCKTENKHKYRILIQKGLREDLGKMPEIFDDHAKIVIITDKNVGKYYLASVKKQLRHYGGEVYAIVIKAGEASKCLSEVEEIYFRLQELNFTRKDLIVALGGGVVGDLAGFYDLENDLGWKVCQRVSGYKIDYEVINGTEQLMRNLRVTSSAEALTMPRPRPSVRDRTSSMASSFFM